MTDAITPAAVDDASLPELALAPLEPPCAPEVDEPPDAPPDEPPVEPDEPVTDELPRAPVPDDELPIPPDDVVFAPVLDEPDGDEPPVEPDADDPLRPPLLPALLEPILPVAPAFVLPPTLEPVDGLALDDEPPDMLPDEPALADEPGLLLFRLLDLSSFPMLDWSLPMLLLPGLLASTPFPSLDF